MSVGSVVAKMSCWHIDRGPSKTVFQFGAVYEGRNELQAISENAIFGGATPQGHMNITGVSLNGLEKDEEYFIELWGDDGIVPEGHALAVGDMECVYRSDPILADARKQWMLEQFRFVGKVDGEDAVVSLGMHISNWAASDYLREFSHFRFVIRLARGKRKDAEIAIIQQMVDEAHKSQGWGHDPKAGDEQNASQQAAWKRYVAGMEKKLRIAKGEAA